MEKATREDMPRRESLFWDTDPMKVDPEKNARYIIERVLDFGTMNELRWLFSYYPRSTLKQTLEEPRSVLQRKSKALWSLVLQ